MLKRGTGEKNKKQQNTFFPSAKKKSFANGPSPTNYFSSSSSSLPSISISSIPKSFSPTHFYFLSPPFFHFSKSLRAAILLSHQL